MPKSYYVIDHDGHKSDVVYFRSKRDVELFPLLRMKRGGGSSASSQSSAQASASSNSNSGSGGGGGGAPFYPGGNGMQTLKKKQWGFENYLKVTVKFPNKYFFIILQDTTQEL